MTRLFLAAGVAALAITMPAAARPGGDHGNGGHGGGPPQGQQHGGGGNPHFQGGGGGGHGGGNPHFQAFGGGGGRNHGGGFARPQFQAFGGRGHGGRFAAPRMQRFAMPRQHGGGQRFAAQRPQHQFRMQRHAQNHGFARQQFRGRQMRQAENRGFARQQMRANRAQVAQNRRFERHQLRQNREAFAQNQRFAGPQMRGNRVQQFRQQAFANRLNAQAFNGGGKFGDNAGAYLRDQQQAYRQALNGTAFAPIYYGGGAQYLAPTVVENFIGAPVQSVPVFSSLSPFPASLQYLYPATNDYYYEYGDGYAYQIDRGTDLIDALVPLLAGGYMPGQYLPQPYMASYVPDYYGLDSFYPDYGDTCNRYANGVVYEVDCASGMVEDVIPLYASGYGVGQILPSSYAYYNVPYQYRRMYYDTPDYNYWYAPGAIYQYDPRSSMITSVAALLGPGFTVGQALPVGYDVYNVPYGYRSTFYDTPNAWYRYSNGYIYQVDPVTRLVTAIVASLLT